MGNRLTQDDAAKINAIIARGTDTNVVLYQTLDFDPSVKAKDTRTGAVEMGNAIGDVAHFLAHGLTLGGMVHMAARSGSQEGNWRDLTDNVRSRAESNHLTYFQNIPCTQLIVLGRKYITFYEKGEYSKRIIDFKDVVQIFYGPGGLTYITKNPQKPGKYNAYMISKEVKFIEKLAVWSIENCLWVYGQENR